MSGAEEREYRLKRTRRYLIQKAMEGMSEDLLRDRIRNLFNRETPKEWNQRIQEIVSTARHCKSIRDTVLGRPWNVMKEYLDKIIKEE